LICHNCLTGDHEVLTREGWRRLDSLEGTEVVAAQWCPETSALTWHHCPIVRQQYTGDMFEWDSNFHKGHYTADHRIYRRTADKLHKPWQVISASQMAGFGANNQLVPVSGLLDGIGLGLTDAECRVLEMVRADAHVQQKTGFTRFRLSKPRKILRCMQLLQEAEMPFVVVECSDGATSISVHKCDAMDKIVALLGRSKDKAYGAWVLDLTLSNRQAILDEMIYWDSCITRKGSGQGGFPVFSAKESELDWLATIASVSGRSGTVKPMRPNTQGFSKPDGVLGHVMIRPRQMVKALNEAVKTEAFNLPVYCLNTETGAFLVRRQGATWVTGNCKFDYDMLTPIGEIYRTICTLEESRHWLKGPKNYKLATLAEYYGIKADNAHQALSDCYTTLAILREIVKVSGRTLSQLADVKVREVLRQPWGVHAGKLMIDVPESYLNWMLRECEDLEANLKRAVEKALELK
jgi:uncharacterized protein (DUF3820 family)